MSAPDATIAAALREATRVLAPTGDTARLDAELLMAHALGVDRSALLVHHQHCAPPPGIAAAFAALVARRAQHEPLAYIVGHQEFHGRAFAVSPAVLIPRADSETLIDVARAALANHPPRRILDLGTGSGALLLTALALWPEASGVGIDVCPAALAIADANARCLLGGLLGAGTWRLLQRDWTTPGWADGLGRFDLILANPPYVETTADLAAAVRAFEPARALFAGADGLDNYRVLLPQLASLLTPAGLAVIEIGAGQCPAVIELATMQGFAVTAHLDLGGRPRALSLTFGHAPAP